MVSPKNSYRVGLDDDLDAQGDGTGGDDEGIPALSYDG